MSTRRVRAIFVKELREYRRNGNIIAAMAVVPLVFVLQPLIQVFQLPDSASGAVGKEHSLLYMLAIPTLVPAVLAAYSVVGERLQGTLEPVLVTPVRRDEFLLAKALAAFVPSVAIASAVFALFVAVIELFASRVVADALIQGPELLAQLVFTPLLAAWSVWVGIGVSARSSDPRTAAQVSLLLSVPTVAVTTLFAFNVLPASLAVSLVCGVGLVVLICFGWRVASAVFDRERIITGAPGTRISG
jgi:ABC-type transport system involved in multi-copper enzyme maturation permease subunit